MDRRAEVVIAGVELGQDAADLVAAAGVDVAGDLARVAEGLDYETLLADCLAGAEPRHTEGWADYVTSIFSTATARAQARAAELGARDGVAEVECVLCEQGLEVITATLAPGHVRWDEAAMNASAHKISKVRDEDMDAYYEAYARAARARAEQLVASAERADETALTAIVDSIRQDRIVTLRAFLGSDEWRFLTDRLAAESADGAASGALREYWGVDADGNEWRVHVDGGQP